MLNPKIKQKWIDVLRSGKYKQGKCLLRNYKNEFCCLGVLCDIIDPGKWKLLEGWKHYNYNDNFYCVPSDVLSNRLQADLIEKNDVKVWDFKKIADYIKTEL